MGNETENRILQGALSIFFSTGVKYFTMEGVADLVGISKRTLYKYYPSRTKLVDCLVENLLRRIESIFTHSIESEKNPVRQFHAIFSQISDLLSTIPMNRLAELKLHYPQTWKKVERFREEREADWFLIFSEGQRKGYFRKDIDVTVLAKIHTRVINSVFHPEFFINNNVSVLDTLPVLIRMMTGGILTEKGKKYDIHL